MKRLSIFAAFSLFTTTCLFSQWDWYDFALPPHPEDFVKVYTFTDFPYTELAKNASTGEYLKPLADCAGNWVFVLKDEIALYTASFKLIARKKLSFNPYTAADVKGYISGTRLFGAVAGDRLYINRYNDELCDFSIPVDPEYLPVFGYDDVAILWNGAKKAYLGYRIERTGNYSVLLQEELVAYLCSRPPVLFDRGLETIDMHQWEYIHNELWFMEFVPLTRTFLNYDGERIVNTVDGLVTTIGRAKVPALKDKKGTQYPYLMDVQGNLWIVECGVDSGNAMAFYYHGKDWQSICSYIKGVDLGTALESGIRIRLTPDTDGLVLGKVTAGQKVSILQKGPEATIADKTGNWYKIETVEGIIGWVFGPFFTQTYEPAYEE